MNKNILTAAIGAALIAGPLAAQADLKISGRVSGSFYSEDGTLQFQDHGNTRLQFDLKDDSGWYARVAKDLRLGRMRVSTTAGNDTSLRTDRDQYVGFKGDMGSFSFGRIAGAAKNLEKDPFIATFLELRTALVKGGSLGSSSFRNSLIQFSSKFGDASVKIQYGPDDIHGTKGGIHLGVKAKMAGANVFVGYNNLMASSGVSAGTFYKLGGSMKFGDIKGKFYYESDGGRTAGDETTWVLGAEMGLGDGQIIDVSYSDKGTVRGSSAYRVAYMKKASKKARYWIGYTQNGSGNGADAATYGAGARVDF